MRRSLGVALSLVLAVPAGATTRALPAVNLGGPPRVLHAGPGIPSIPSLPPSAVVPGMLGGTATGVRMPAGNEAAIPRGTAATPAERAGVASAASQFVSATQAGDAGAAEAFSLSRKLFDLAAEAAPGPRLDSALVENPVALSSLETRVDTVATERDIDAAMPGGSGGTEMSIGLKARLGAMAPYQVVTYRAKGGPIVALDLSNKPNLAGLLPEKQPHEVRLIQKIQLWTDDLKVVVREDIKTPDLIVGGIMTELKTVGPDGPYDFTEKVKYANSQVLEHAARHGLGGGAVAVELASEPSVPVSKISAELNAWAPTATVGLDTVYVFAGRELKVFSYDKPARVFRLNEPARVPAAPMEPQDAELRAKRESAAKRFEQRVRAVLPLVSAPDRVAVETQETPRFVQELEEPGRLLREAGVKATVTVYGSARLKPDSFWYREARRFGELVALFGGKELAVVTGGGPGIMEAANRGAFEAGGPSVGYNIHLEFEQDANPYITPGLGYEFEYFATRKINLRRGAVALAYFPGGFGTLDELFEVLTLIQTKKMARVPIVLVGGKDYWEQAVDFKKLSKMGLISGADLSLFRFVENADEAWAAVAGSMSAAPR